MTRFFSDSVGQNETNVQAGVRRISPIGGTKNPPRTLIRITDPEVLFKKIRSTKDLAEPWFFHLGTDASPEAQHDNLVRSSPRPHVCFQCLNGGI
jgi:hypothetical protein